jgi:hypothetical protein
MTNGGSISGANTATLVINPAGAGDAVNNYNCLVMNVCGSIYSNDAGLVVRQGLGDIDEDGDVDQSDFGLLQRCLGMPLVGSCMSADLNLVGSTVDYNDVVRMLRCMSGAGIPADPSCAE